MANFGYMKSPTAIIKVTVVVFSLIALLIMRIEDLYLCVGVDASYFGIGALVCSLIVTPLLIIVNLMGDTEVQKTIMEPCLNFTLAILLLVFGGLAMDKATEFRCSYNRDSGIAMAVFGLLSGILYLADSILAALKYRSS